MGFSKRVLFFILLVLLVLYFINNLLNLPPLIRWYAAKTFQSHLEDKASLPNSDHVNRAASTVVAPSATMSPQVVDRASTATTQKTTKVPKPAGTTEPSYIGDNYITDDRPPQTTCKDGIRQRVNKTDFGKLFQHRVPIFQWWKHGTQDEYKRLHKYPGAHGWGGVEYDTLMATLSILNTTANQLMFDDWKQRANGSSCIRCAVVGNGGILKGSKMGQEIDQHDYVFRTNGAVIQGFEKDVGTRTTMYTFSTNTMRNSIYSYANVGFKGPPMSEETRYLFLPDHDRDYLLLRAAATHTPVQRGPESNYLPSRFFGDDVTVEKFKIYHPDFIRYIRNRFLYSSHMNSKYRDIYRPSTGAVMLLAALHTCDQVSAYGFMTPDYQKYSNHYYDKNNQKVAFFVNHDLRMEMMLWQKLHKDRLIRLYTHQ